MRIYLSATLPALARALQEGRLGVAGRPVHAVTPALRESYASADEEELEYAAMTAAARSCLDLLAADPQAPRRRVVVAGDVPDSAVRAVPGGPPSLVQVGQDLLLREVAAVHVDDPEAIADVAAAVAALGAAATGDEDARWVLDAVTDHELLWYAAQELADLVS